MHGLRASTLLDVDIALLQLGILATGVVVKPSCRACRTNLRRNALPDLR
jgi:hypothetical protein